MVDSKHITDTNARLLNGITNVVDSVIEKKNIDGKIEKTVKDNMITTGVMKKYYPYLNKCQVKLDNTGKLVFCELISLFSGDLVFMFTPSGDESFCETLREPCIIPRGNLNVLVANINHKNYDYVMLGYYFPDDFVGFSPAKASNFKIMAVGAVNEYSINFGVDGLKITTGEAIESKTVDDWGNETQQEQYSRTEIDEMIKKMKEELKNEILDTINNNVTGDATDD